jgi:survival of motor neuron protein-interacting protein 1
MNNKRGIHNLLTSLPEIKRSKINENTKECVSSETRLNDDDDYQEDKPHHTLTSTNQGYVQGPIDPVFGQRKAFPIVIDIKNIDLNKIPENVNEYLAQVRAEASGSQDMNNNIGSDFEDLECIYYNHPRIEPINKETNDQYIIPLSVLERYLDEYKNKREEYEEFRSNLHELDAIELPKTAKEWKKFIWEVSCEKEYIAQIIEEAEQVKLLVYLGKWLGLKVDDNYELWMFNVLAAIEEVVSSSEISVLRQMGKKARRQLEQTDYEDGVHARVLAIIGLFFKQRDLLVK